MGGGSEVLIVLESNQNHATAKETEVCTTLPASMGNGGGYVPMVVDAMMNAVSIGNGQLHSMGMMDIANALDCMHDAQAILIMGAGDELTENEKPMVGTSVVRRLTPLECERLQGMPDNWSKYGINEKGEVYELPDSARYRLQGNGIATPFFRWILKRISAQYERTPTLGSLFDGQGSFPMIWEDINGKGTALWSSEIEKHAIAVAKYHFPESEMNND